MRMKFAFLVMVATFIATASSAMPINNLAVVARSDATVKNVRIVCNSKGYCRSTKPYYVRQYYAPRNYSYDSYAARDYGYAPRSYAPLLNYSYAPLYYGYAVPGYYGYFPLYYGDFSPGYW